MKLYDMTWPEVEDYLKIRQSIIIPSGTCEQHGKHLALNTNTLITEYIAEFLSEETGIIIAPTLNYGVNLPCDRYYSGTCSLTEDILKNQVKAILECGKSRDFLLPLQKKRVDSF